MVRLIAAFNCGMKVDMKKCETCGGDKYVIWEEWINGEYGKRRYTCPDCDGTGVIREVMIICIHCGAPNGGGVCPLCGYEGSRIV
jgi:hypothetical protein